MRSPTSNFTTAPLVTVTSYSYFFACRKTKKKYQFLTCRPRAPWCVFKPKSVIFILIPNGSAVGYDSDTINATIITIDCLSKTITFRSDYISLSPQRDGFKMSFSMLKSRSTAALEAAAWREILKEGRAH